MLRPLYCFSSHFIPTLAAIIITSALLLAPGTLSSPRSAYAADSYTQVSNLGNPAHRHATEGHLPKEAVLYSSAMCKSAL
jgi:hypothetical protein